MTYHSLAFIIIEDESERMRFSIELLRSIEMSGLSPHSDRLKPGTILCSLETWMSEKI